MMMNDRSREIKNEDTALIFDDRDQRERESEDQISFSELCQKNIGIFEYSSLDFMDILGINDHQNPLFGYLELSEVVNTPTTTIAASPNSPSISSSSHYEYTQRSKLVDHEEAQEQDDHDNNKTKIQLKAKKKNAKRQREPRFAFMTKSEVDHLDDGYRWRKYGQKAVKNSPFPRSYHRCTTTSCGVKKRVERCCEDPSIVVTTYEGIHTHPCPLPSHHRTHNIGLLKTEPATFGVGATNFIFPNQQQQPYYGNQFQTPIMSFQTSSNNMKEGYPSSLLRESEYQHGQMQIMMEPKQE